MKPNNIAIYWGAFDPPTIGHTHVMSQVLQETDIDTIILSPDWDRVDKNCKIPIQHKLKIARLYAKHLQQQWLNIQIDTHFLEWKSYHDTNTLEVDRYFRDLHGENIWHIFGSDVMPNMHNWQGNRDEYIEKTLKKIFIPRPWFPIDIDKYRMEQSLAIDSESLDVSSTDVRQLIEQKKSEVAKIIASEDILEYIQKNKLYT